MDGDANDIILLGSFRAKHSISAYDHKICQILLKKLFSKIKCNDNQCATDEFFSPVECTEITKSFIEGGSYYQIVLMKKKKVVSIFF